MELNTDKEIHQLEKALVQHLTEGLAKDMEPEIQKMVADFEASLRERVAVKLMATAESMYDVQRMRTETVITVRLPRQPTAG